MTIEQDRPCLDASQEGCAGPVETFHGPTFTTRFWPRCQHHSEAHQDSQGLVWDGWGRLLAKPWLVTADGDIDTVTG